MRRFAARYDNRRSRLFTVALAIAVAAGVIAPVTVEGASQPAAASETRVQSSDPNQFSAGNIISDAVFFNSSAMSAAQVQTFLERQVTSCLSGYTCLKDYQENTNSRAADQYCPGIFYGSASQRASDIIYNVAQACGINPQVLVVLLQKEQGLVSSRSPSATAYQRATGYGCPDTAPCNAEFFGFANQVWRAARQYQVYRLLPGSFNHRPGRVSALRLHPNAACGSTPVYIENQATAGLYNYTPYQPNLAALNNLYGTGDACSSYGNRNFWRLFNDWFGNPQGGGSLVRTVTDGAIYLVTASKRYPVRSTALFSALLSSLGPYQFVTQGYLDQLTVGVDASPLLRDETTGAIYLAASGQKNKFDDCAMVARWGLGESCGAYIDIMPSQVAKFATGSSVRMFALSDSTGVIYWINDGKKYALTAGSQMATLAAGGSTEYTRIPQQTLDLIPSGPDIYDPLAVVKVSSAPALYLMNGPTGLVRIDDGALLSAYGLPAHTVMSSSTFATKTVASAPLALAVSCNGAEMIAGGGKVWQTTTSSGIVPTVLDPATCAALSVSTIPVTGAIFLREPTSGAIYRIAAGAKTAMSTMAEVNALNGANPLVLIPTTASLLAAIPTAYPPITPATLAKSAGSAIVYLIDGARKVPLGSFAVAAEFGIRGYTTVGAHELNALTTVPGLLSLAVDCGGAPFIAGNGSRWPVANTAGLPVSSLDPTTCNAIPVASTAVTGSTFLRDETTGSVWYLADGTRRHVTTMAKVNELNGSAPLVFIPVGAGALASIPVGAEVR